MGVPNPADTMDRVECCAVYIDDRVQEERWVDRDSFDPTAFRSDTIRNDEPESLRSDVALLLEVCKQSMRCLLPPMLLRMLTESQYTSVMSGRLSLPNSLSSPIVPAVNAHPFSLFSTLNLVTARTLFGIVAKPVALRGRMRDLRLRHLFAAASPSPLNPTPATACSCSQGYLQTFKSPRSQT